MNISLSACLSAAAFCGAFFAAAAATTAAESEPPEVPTAAEAEAIIEAEMAVRAAREQHCRTALLAVPALEEWESPQTDGTRTLFRRVTTPPPQPASAPTPSTTAAEPSNFSPPETRHRTITLAATVFDHSHSELHWRDPEGRSWQVWSNVDFNLLANVTAFGDDAVAWTPFVFVSNSSSSEQQAMIQLAAELGETYNPPTGPDPALFTSDDPEYIVFAESESEVPEILFEKLDALLAYFSENQERLAAEHERRSRLNEARRQWQEQNPPAKRDTVINFWSNP